VRHTGELEGELVSLRRTSEPLKESLAPWIRKLSELSDDTGPMYGADEGMIESSRLILEAIACAGVILSVADSKSRDLCLDLLSRSSFATKSACASLELQAEAYIYSGSRRDAKRRMKRWSSQGLVDSRSSIRSGGRCRCPRSPVPGEFARRTSS